MRVREGQKEKQTQMDMEELVEDRVHVDCREMDYYRKKKVKGEKEEGDSRKGNSYLILR